MGLKVETIPVTMLQQNCALIWNDETFAGAVIDPGGDEARILAAVAKHGVKVESIFLTHGHLDHAGGASELARKLQVKISGPGIADKFLLNGLAEQAKQFGIQAEDCTPDTWAVEGETIEIGNAAFEVLHCPGHTPGHVVFINRAAKFGIFGDVLFRNSIGRTDFPYGDTAALLGAIKSKLLCLPDDFAFICGHGPPSTIGTEKRGNPFVR